MSYCIKFLNGFKKFISWGKPEFHKHYENNFDFKEYYQNIKDLIGENAVITKERDELTIKLRNALERNRVLTEKIDTFNFILLEILPHTTLDKHKIDRYQHILNNED